MFSSVVLLVAVGVLPTAAVPQHGHSVAKGAKHVIACPVTGDKVDMDRASKSKMYAEYKGNRYFFCCKGCPPAFKKNPSKYASKPHIKVPKAKRG